MDNIELRDYFAGKALQGLLASNTFQYLGADSNTEDYIKTAYRFADAMIKEKESTNYKESLKTPAFDRLITRDDGK